MQKKSNLAHFGHFCLFKSRTKCKDELSTKGRYIFNSPKTSKYLNMRGDLVMFWYLVRMFSCHHYHHYTISHVNITTDVWWPSPGTSICPLVFLRCQLYFWLLYTERMYNEAEWSGRCELCESRTATEAWGDTGTGAPAGLIPHSWSALTHGDIKGESCSGFRGKI